jgi:hypothetical protein
LKHERNHFIGLPEMKYDLTDVSRAIDALRLKLGRSANVQLQAEFEAGLHPNLLSYEKIQASGVAVPILDRYLIGATTFLHQPCNYYDIFRVCRCVNMVQFLNSALGVLMAKQVRGLDTRLDRLMQETEHDAFDAIAFELVTAARYAGHPAVDRTEFVPETSDKKTPDLLVRAHRVNSFAECKKVDRTQNYTLLIRDAVCNHLNAVISALRSAGISVLLDVAFSCDPRDINQARLVEAVRAAFDNRTPIIDAQFTVTATHLPRYDSESYTLFPSPFFFWQRYGYRIRSEWFGIVHQFHGSFARRADLPSHLHGGSSSWLNELDWDAAAKWKITSDEVVAKYRRFAFGGVFKGLDQIKHRGINSSVHLWLETDYYVGSRKNTFVDLFKRLAANQRDAFGWLMINETLFDVSPKGHFDLIEHAHMIRGPTAFGSHPLVSAVFAPDPSGTTGEFGTGRELPDIDQ